MIHRLLSSPSLFFSTVCPAKTGMPLSPQINSPPLSWARSGFFSSRPLVSSPSCEMAQDITRLTKQIAALIRENARETNIWADTLGYAAPSLGTQLRGDRNVDVDNSTAYLKLFTMTLEFALFPRAIRRPNAAALNYKSKLDSWNLASKQVRGYLQLSLATPVRPSRKFFRG